MENQNITYRFAEIGHWLARCNHQTKVIELNAREFNSLSPLLKDYVWVHECVHLLTDVRDEAACNKISDEIFISRAKNARDRRRRMDFVLCANNQNLSRVTRPAPAPGIMLLVLLSVFLILKN